MIESHSDRRPCFLLKCGRDHRHLHSQPLGGADAMKPQKEGKKKKKKQHKEEKPRRRWRWWCFSVVFPVWRKMSLALLAGDPPAGGTFLLLRLSASVRFGSVPFRSTKRVRPKLAAPGIQTVTDAPWSGSDIRSGSDTDLIRIWTGSGPD